MANAVGLNHVVELRVPGAEDLLAGEIRANRIFADNGSGIGRVAKDRDGKGEAGLCLELPSTRASRG